LTAGNKQTTKSGREAEVVFIPQKLANRLNDYIREKGIDPDKRIFPITYSAARSVIVNAGKMVGIQMRPHDRRRHSASHASRSGTPIEFVSKVIRRHASLSTTMIYTHVLKKGGMGVKSPLDAL